jgi:hypothetical protein
MFGWNSGRWAGGRLAALVLVLGLALLHPWKAAAQCCACTGCSAQGFCVDDVSGSIACATLCSNAGCDNIVFQDDGACTPQCDGAEELPTATPTDTPTGTPTGTASATVTPTDTAVPPSHTPTRTPSVSPTASSTPVDTPTATRTQTATHTGAVTATASASATRTTSGTAVHTATITPTHTGMASPTDTPTGTPTGTVSATVTASATITPTVSPTHEVTATSTASATPTVEGTVTSTATASHTPTGATATATPSASVTATATATPSGSPIVIQVGTASGNPGKTVGFAVTLTSTAQLQIAATTNCIAIDANVPFAQTATHAPDCTVNDAIQKADSSFAFAPSGCDPSSTCQSMCADIHGANGTPAIPQGAMLYSCRIAIPNTTANATYPLDCPGPNGGKTEQGNPVAANCSAGAVIVQTNLTGDCDGNGEIAINELITAVNVSLGTLPISACPAFNTSPDGMVTIDQLIVAVNNALAQ